MVRVVLIDPCQTIRQFTPITWKVKFGDWNISYIWQYLYQHEMLEKFNQMDADEQFEFLMDEFVTE